MKVVEVIQRQEERAESNESKEKVNQANNQRSNDVTLVIAYVPYIAPYERTEY
jgi:hypothetical protein